MVTVNNYKEVTETLCYVLAKGKNRDGLMFTNMTELSKKVGIESIGPKDISIIVQDLETKGFVKTLKKSNRQTVLEIRDNIMEIDLNIKEKKEDSSTIQLSISPVKLLQYLRENSFENKVSIQSKKIRDFFDCKFSEIMANLSYLQNKKEIEYTFKSGVVDAIILKDTKENCAQEVAMDIAIGSDNSGLDIASDNSVITVEDEDINIDALFNDIGESLHVVFTELRELRERNEELKKKLRLQEIANKSLREDRDMYKTRCEQMQEMNNRLFNQVVELKNK